MAWLLICSRSPSALSCINHPPHARGAWRHLAGETQTLLRRGGAKNSQLPASGLNFFGSAASLRPGRFCERLSHRHCPAFRAATRFQEPPQV